MAAKQDGAFWPAGLAAERIAWLREQGFKVEGAHIGLAGMVPGGLRTLLPHAMQFAKENGLSYLVHSPQRKSVEEIKADAEALRKAQELLKGISVEILFHTHWQEFTEDNGDTPFAWLMRELPDLRVELDVSWVHFAKADVTAVMKEYADRIAILHFKDLTEDASAENIRDCFTAVGEGSLPLADILACAKKLNLSYTGYIIDQDNSRGDMMEDLRIGIRNLNR